MSVRSHIRRIRFLIEGSGDHDALLCCKMTAKMSCDKVLVTKRLHHHAAAEHMFGTWVILIATQLSAKIDHHLKLCKQCRVARKKVTDEVANSLS